MDRTIHAQVLDIVREALRLDDFDPAWDFFDLGADSLTVVRIVELVRDRCGADVWITDAFDAPDVDAFAELAATRGPAADGNSAPAPVDAP
ncbi:hypothetical protein CIB93_20550 [Streptomyces sp. WZ.A104]|uniref:acyl carrier protein n=1 Tax=Streptomyces sp. WZ.A104 TaxID=2023771 RepID=UPI000BBC7686|nr:acyl carrier protein [Streptomyces sp. WZ.A104]PCG84209.1 hypothetical protein CIB93_20550 [Streptomyces sp. WZ.A104]